MFVAKAHPLLVGLEEAVQKEVFGHMLTVSKKLAKVADAVDAYEEMEEKEIERILSEAKKSGHIVIEDSSKLDGRTEDALSQAKSTLDVTVKVLKPILNISLGTYGKGGKSVIKALENNLGSEFKERALPLINMIEDDSKWIDNFKKYRDDQHFGNLGVSVIRANPKGEFEIPLMPQQGGPVRLYLATLYENVYTFALDFFAGAINIRLPKTIYLAPTGSGLGRDYVLMADFSSAHANKAKGKKT